MRLSNGIYCVVIVALISASMRLWAHHSFAAEYDGTKAIKLSGTVTKFDMVNPHSWIYVDVKDDTGKVVNWKFETASPSNLYRRGFKKDTIKSGMQVTIEGYLAKDGSATANGQKLYMPDGTVIILGTEVNPG
jgi:Family of unknown function (DUF6152)